MKVKSDSGNSAEETNILIQKLGEQTVSKLSDTQFFKSRLVPVFISLNHGKNAACILLYVDKIDLIGAASTVEFVNGHQSEGAIVGNFKIGYSILLKDL